MRKYALCSIDPIFSFFCFVELYDSYNPVFFILDGNKFWFYHHFFPEYSCVVTLIEA